MPRRDVTVISHSVLTNHRIVAQAEEPFPDTAFHLATDQYPDLVDLSTDPSRHVALDPLMQLQAYAQIVLRYSEYRSRYWALANQLRASHPHDTDVLEALADESLQKHTAEGRTLAVQYLQDAIGHGATNPIDYEELSILLISVGRQNDALDFLRQATKLAPYDANLYRQYAKLLLAQNQMREACQVTREGAGKFPQDDLLRDLAARCAGGAQHNSDN